MATAVPSSPLLAGVGGTKVTQQLLTGGSNKTWLADTVETSSLVQAAAAIEAGSAGAVVQVDGTEAATEASRAHARETVGTIHTCGTIGARTDCTVVHVGLTACTCEPRQAAACQL